MAILKTHEGINLMDPGKGTFDVGTESWIAYGTNTIENDNGSLKTIYVDDRYGAKCDLCESSDLTKDLTVGKTYKIRARCKVNIGTVQLKLSEPWTTIGDVSQTEFTWFETIFTATTLSNFYIISYSMSAGEIIWIDQWSIQEWYPDGKILKYYDPNQPLNIDTSCQVWLDGNDADTFTLDGTSVDQWDDKSGFGRDVSNGNADTTRPTYDSATGRVTFTGANSTFLQSATFGSVLTQPNTVFIVYKITGGTGDNEAVFDGITDLTSCFEFAGGNFRLRSIGTLTDGAANANNNIHVALFNGVSSKYWINGINVLNGNAGIGVLDGITLGARGGLSQYADVEIMEVIIYNADISDVDRDKITGYLADKWDITSTTNFKGYILQM